MQMFNSVWVPAASGWNGLPIFCSCSTQLQSVGARCHSGNWRISIDEILRSSHQIDTLNKFQYSAST